LDAAAGLFAEKGYAGTSAREIAERAGVAVGLMYHYYKSKEDVYNGLVEVAHSEIDAISEIFDRADSVYEGMKILAGQILEGFCEGYDFAQWIKIIPESGYLVDRLLNYLTQQQAQFFASTLLGICDLQLSLRDKFKPPTIDMMIAFMIGEENE